MRVLKFLINAGANLLVEKLIDYMIDAGHEVYINAASNVESLKNKYTHNFRLVNLFDFDLRKIDYIFNL